VNEVEVKKVNGVSIYLDSTDYSASYIYIGIVVLLVAAIIFMGYSLSTSTTSCVSSVCKTHIEDLPFQAMVVCFVSGLGLWFMIAFGVFSKPAYEVYVTGRSSRIVPIQNDGTDQARVCIAVKAFEREILAEMGEDETLKKIAAGCR
jgi:hypothetical protein